MGANLKEMNGDLRLSFYKAIRGIGYGLLGATLSLHATPYFKRILKMTESREFDKEHPQYEQLMMCIAGVVGLIMEPLFYIVFTVDAVNSHGVRGLFWLSPIVICQGFGLSLVAYQKLKRKSPF